MFTLFRGSEVHHREALIQNAAKTVARHTRTNLNATTANMNVSELRGYLRTRAARAAREQVRRIVAEVRMTPDDEADLTTAVLERAVHLVIRDLMVGPIVSIPTPHVRTRAA